MPPTIHQNTEREKRPRGAERRSDLVCRVKYCNTLPDIPFDPKFINYPFSANRYVQYKPTSLEKNYKHEVLTELDLGVDIDLINPDSYIAHPDAILHPDDEKLLEDDVLLPQDAKRSRHHHVNVSWLRRTEYISTETTRYQPLNVEKAEATVGFATKRKVQQQEENLYTDRESQLNAIEGTFKKVKRKVLKHYSKPGVTAVEEFPVFPDFEMWKYPCAQVIFDSDPAPVGRSVPAQMEEMSQAMIRGVMDESGEQFVAYFLPTEETLTKRAMDKSEKREYVEDEEYDYTMAREYNWNVKNKASKGYEENYFFAMRDDGVYYNELETRVRLSKRRLKQGQQANNSRLVVSHRPLNAHEYKMQRVREKMLEPPQEEDELEEEEREHSDAGYEGSDNEERAQRSDNEGSDNEQNERSGNEEKDRSDNESVRSDNEEKDRSDNESVRSDYEEKDRSDNESVKSDHEEKDRSDDESVKSDNEEKDRSDDEGKDLSDDEGKDRSGDEGRDKSYEGKDGSDDEMNISENEGRNRSNDERKDRSDDESGRSDNESGRSDNEGNERSGSDRNRSDNEGSDSSDSDDDKSD